MIVILKRRMDILLLHIPLLIYPRGRYSQGKTCAGRVFIERSAKMKHGVLTLWALICMMAGESAVHRQLHREYSLYAEAVK
jgi:hypothetical protein